MATTEATAGWGLSTAIGAAFAYGAFKAKNPVAKVLLGIGAVGALPIALMGPNGYQRRIEKRQARRAASSAGDDVQLVTATAGGLQSNSMAGYGAVTVAGAVI